MSVTGDDEVFVKVRSLALDIIDAPEDLFTPDAKLSETLEMDSTHLIEMAEILESTYDIVLEEQELADLVTVQDYVDLVVAKRSGSG